MSRLNLNLRSILAAIPLAMAMSASSFAAVESCNLKFDVVAENSIGNIAAGERLQGTIDFTIRSAWQQDQETVSYRSKGTIRLAAPGRGAVTGQIGVVHVVRAPYTADYISFDASRAAGDLGGRLTYADPMLVTLYAPPGTLASSDLPRTDEDWNMLSKRRIFQVHTPSAMAIFTGPVENLSGSCK